MLMDVDRFLTLVSRRQKQNHNRRQSVDVITSWPGVVAVGDWHIFKKITLNRLNHVFVSKKRKAVLNIISKMKFSALSMIHGVISLVHPMYGIYCNCFRLFEFFVSYRETPSSVAVWIDLLFPNRHQTWSLTAVSCGRSLPTEAGADAVISI